MAGPEPFAPLVPEQRPAVGPLVGPAREQVLAETFLGLADTLGDDFDVVGLLDRLTGACVALLGVGAAAVLLDDGPAAVSGTGAVARPLGEHRSRGGQGLVVSVPLRRRGQSIGGLDLFVAGPGPLSCDDRRLAQALADAATIGILQHRAVHAGSILAEQLQHALDARVVIEQAKGILAERHGLSLDVAFAVMRRRARGHNLTVDDVARSVLGGHWTATATTAGTVVRPILGSPSPSCPKAPGRDSGRRRCGCRVSGPR